MRWSRFEGSHDDHAKFPISRLGRYVKNVAFTRVNRPSHHGTTNDFLSIDCLLDAIFFYDSHTSISLSCQPMVVRAVDCRVLVSAWLGERVDETQAPSFPNKLNKALRQTPVNLQGLAGKIRVVTEFVVLNRGVSRHKHTRVIFANSRLCSADVGSLGWPH